MGGKKISFLLQQFYEHFRSKTHKKSSYSSEMQNYALMHREGLKGNYLHIYFMTVNAYIYMCLAGQDLFGAQALT